MQSTGEGGGGKGWREASGKGREGVKTHSGKHLLFIFFALNRAAGAWRSL